MSEVRGDVRGTRGCPGYECMKGIPGYEGMKGMLGYEGCPGVQEEWCLGYGLCV